MMVNFANVGGENYEKGLQFIRAKFLALNANKDRQIHTYFTCATDTNLMKQVIDTVNDSILLKQAKKFDNFF